MAKKKNRRQQPANQNPQPKPSEAIDKQEEQQAAEPEVKEAEAPETEEPAEQTPPAEKISAPIEELLGDVVKTQKAGTKKDPEPQDEEDDEYEEEEPEKKKKPKTKANLRQIKHGMSATVLTIVFIAAVVLVNVIATVLFERYPLTFDLTSKKKFSISEESIDYVKTINTDVLITVFADEDDFCYLSDYTNQAVEVMKKYSQYNSRITYRFVPIDSNPDIVADYGVDTTTTYDIIVETNPTSDIKRTRKIVLTDLVEFQSEFLQNLNSYYGMTIEQLAKDYGALRVLRTYGSAVEASRADEAFVSAFMAVADPNPTTAVFLTGCAEVTDLAYLHTLLEANGYFVQDIDITKEEIPEEAALAIIPAPTKDYLPEEVQKVEDFLTNDGKMGKQLLYCASIQQGKTPNLDELLAEWGLQFDEAVICEQNTNFYYQMPFNSIAANVSENFTQDVSTDSPKLLNLGSRPIKLLFDERGNTGTEAYVTSNTSAYAADMNTGEKLSSGQQIYTAVASRAVFDTDGVGTYSNIIAYGAVETLSDSYLQNARFNNREYVLSLLNGLTGKTSTGITIEPTVIQAELYSLTEKQTSVLQWTFMLIIPAVVLLTGGIIWYRRKNR
ncbi:MAG: GldG family protein [Ruminococcus sp.]|nr:GldG family protein [Ruminococcus sp.]